MISDALTLAFLSLLGVVFSGLVWDLLFGADTQFDRHVDQAMKITKR